MTFIEKKNFFLYFLFHNIISKAQIETKIYDYYCYKFYHISLFT